MGEGAFIPVGASEKADVDLQLPAADWAPRGDSLPGKAPFQRQQVQGQAPATSLGSLQPVAEEATPVLSGYRIPLKPFELAFCRLPPEKVQMNGTI